MHVARGDLRRQRTTHVGRHRARESCTADERSTTIEVFLLLEARHEFWTQPAWCAVELVLSQAVTRDEVDVVALFLQAQRDLARRDPPTDNGDSLGASRPLRWLLREDVLHT